MRMAAVEPSVRSRVAGLWFLFRVMFFTVSLLSLSYINII